MPQYVTAIRTSEGDKLIDYTALANKEHAKQHSASGTDPILLTDIGAAKATHASQHSSVGSDPITPSDIGAAKKDHASQHATGGADPIAPASIGAASLTHASQHAAGGADAITPEMIGTYTKEQILSAETAAAFGLGEGAEPKDFFKKMYDDGGASRVGDILSTVRIDLDDSWILCDGTFATENDYPDLKKLITTPGLKMIKATADAGNEDYYYSITDIAYYDGRWVAVGYLYNSIYQSYPIILTTTNPSGTWTYKQISTNNRRLTAVACYNGTWVAAGYESYNTETRSPYAYITTDPTGTWTESVISTTKMSFSHIACYDGLWVGISGAALYTTTTPYGTWTKNANWKSSWYAYDLCYNNGTWVFLTPASKHMPDISENTYYSYPKVVITTDPSGSDFTEVELPFNNVDISPLSICCNGSMYVVSGRDDSTTSKTHYIYTATNPSGAWTAKDVSSMFGYSAPLEVLYCNGEWVFVGANSRYSKTYVCTTTNPTKTSTWKVEDIPNYIDVVRTAFTNDTWVAVGQDSDKNVHILSSALIQLPNISLDRVNTYIKGKQ